MFELEGELLIRNADSGATKLVMVAIKMYGFEMTLSHLVTCQTSYMLKILQTVFCWQKTNYLAHVVLTLCEKAKKKKGHSPL